MKEIDCFMYTVENYRDRTRFNGQYEVIQQFLLKNSDTGYNEHFHWGRFEWMMNHTFLDVDELTSIAIVRNDKSQMVGLITYDTYYDDRFYMIYSIPDKDLLDTMIGYVMSRDENPCVKANDGDRSLAERLQRYTFSQNENEDDHVLEFDLTKNLNYELPAGIRISPTDFVMDSWKYQMVIHKGFNNVGTPEKWNDEVLKPTPNYNPQLCVFALSTQEYCAHCGIWYKQGRTAYIEPVVTIPEYRKKGLGKAVVYEAMNRAKKLGAKRAVVLSEQEFYYRIGFTDSSKFFSWKRK